MGVGSGGTTPSQRPRGQTGQPGRPREWMPRIELRRDLRTLHHRDNERRTRVASQTSASPRAFCGRGLVRLSPHPNSRRSTTASGAPTLTLEESGCAGSDRIELQPRHHRRHHRHQVPPRRQPVVAELPRRAAIFCIPAVGQARLLMPLDQRILVGTSAITICCVPGMRPMPAWADRASRRRNSANHRWQGRPGCSSARQAARRRFHPRLVTLVGDAVDAHHAAMP